jgi:hypothetical protein
MYLAANKNGACHNWQAGGKIMKRIIITLAVGLPISFSTTSAVHAQPTPPKKLCSVFVPGNWRDTITVDQPGWFTIQCNTYRVAVGATQLQLGCLTPTGFSFGQPYVGQQAGNANFPPDNSCGWSND